jgi:U4/U6.U5 tri-snRNP-associated protein 1
VPQLAEFLDNRELSKANSKAEKGKKKKIEGEATPVIPSVDITGFVAVPTNHSAGTAPSTGTATPASSAAPPSKMKPAFSRVAAEPVSGSASPGGGLERGKVAFGFAIKRKAENEGDGTNSPKRR